MGSMIDRVYQRRPPPCHLCWDDSPAAVRGFGGCIFAPCSGVPATPKACFSGFSGKLKENVKHVTHCSTTTTYECTACPHLHALCTVLSCLWVAGWVGRWGASSPRCAEHTSWGFPPPKLFLSEGALATLRARCNCFGGCILGCLTGATTLSLTRYFGPQVFLREAGVKAPGSNPPFFARPLPPPPSLPTQGNFHVAPCLCRRASSLFEVVGECVYGDGGIWRTQGAWWGGGCNCVGHRPARVSRLAAPWRPPPASSASHAVIPRPSGLGRRSAPHPMRGAVTQGLGMLGHQVLDNSGNYRLPH